MAAPTILRSGGVATRWCFSKRKRLFDAFVSVLLLIPATPLLLLLAAAVRMTSPGPVLFRQWRLGQWGRPFQLLKFRTMRHEPPGGALLTSRGDSRITPTGRWLRAWKLDELPQLINVLRGEMSLVGPRPDLEKFWRELDPDSRRIFDLKPGITGAASLAFRNEEELLAQVPAGELTSFYVTHLLPQKAALDLDYAAHASFRSDCAMLVLTALKVLGASTSAQPRPRAYDQVSR